MAAIQHGHTFGIQDVHLQLVWVLMFQTLTTCSRRHWFSTLHDMTWHDMKWNDITLHYIKITTLHTFTYIYTCHAMPCHTVHTYTDGGFVNRNSFKRPHPRRAHGPIPPPHRSPGGTVESRCGRTAVTISFQWHNWYRWRRNSIEISLSLFTQI